MPSLNSDFLPGALPRHLSIDSAPARGLRSPHHRRMWSPVSGRIPREETACLEALSPVIRTRSNTGSTPGYGKKPPSPSSLRLAASMASTKRSPWPATGYASSWKSVPTAPRSVRLQLRAIRTLVKLLEVRSQLDAGQNNNLREAMARVLAEVAIPLGIKFIPGPK